MFLIVNVKVSSPYSRLRWCMLNCEFYSDFLSLLIYVYDIPPD